MTQIIGTIMGLVAVYLGIVGLKNLDRNVKYLEDVAVSGKENYDNVFDKAPIHMKIYGFLFLKTKNYYHDSKQTKLILKFLLPLLILWGIIIILTSYNELWQR
jgi:hypothetical protein